MFDDMKDLTRPCTEKITVLYTAWEKNGGKKPLYSPRSPSWRSVEPTTDMNDDDDECCSRVRIVSKGWHTTTLDMPETEPAMTNWRNVGGCGCVIVME